MTANDDHFNVKANDIEFSFSQAEIDAIDLIKRPSGDFNIIHDFQSYNARLIESDATGKKVKIELAGEVFEVEIKDQLDQMLDQMGFSAVSTKHIREIKAPMPGLVLEIAVQEGQSVKEGEKLLILEAMKMENSIQAHADAVIKNITVKPGQAVDKGQVMIILE